MNFPYGIVCIIPKKKYAITESDNHSLRIIEFKDPQVKYIQPYES